MAARAYIVTSRLSDSGVITASSSVSNAVPANLQLSRPRLIWRSTTTTPYLEIDLLSTQTFDTLFLGYVRARSASDTFRIRDASSQSGLVSAPDYDSATLNPSGIPLWPAGSDLSKYGQIHRAFALPATRSNRWVRVDFNFASNPLGYVQLSRIGVGKRIEPVVSVKSGWAPGGSEPIAETVDMGGEESARVMGTKRTLTATWHDLTHAEMDLLLATLTERGSARDLLLAIDPSEGAYPMSHLCLGRVKQSYSVTQTMKVERADDGEHFTVTIVVSELAPIEMM
jgi:hypothetical protein